MSGDAIWAPFGVWGWPCAAGVHSSPKVLGEGTPSSSGVTLGQLLPGALAAANAVSPCRGGIEELKLNPPAPCEHRREAERATAPHKPLQFWVAQHHARCVTGEASLPPSRR